MPFSLKSAKRIPKNNLECHLNASGRPQSALNFKIPVIFPSPFLWSVKHPLISIIGSQTKTYFVVRKISGKEEN